MKFYLLWLCPLLPQTPTTTMAMSSSSPPNPPSSAAPPLFSNPPPTSGNKTPIYHHSPATFHSRHPDFATVAPRIQHVLKSLNRQPPADGGILYPLATFGRGFLPKPTPASDQPIVMTNPGASPLRPYAPNPGRVQYGSQQGHLIRPTNLPHSLVGSTGATPDLEPGGLVMGTIDAKFDSGYLVTVNLGSEQLKGVLYHIPTASPMSQSRNRFEDPSRPKANRSGYEISFAENYNRTKPLSHRQEIGHQQENWASMEQTHWG